MGSALSRCYKNQSPEQFNSQPSTAFTVGEVKDAERKILSFKDFKGFKKSNDIKENYELKDLIGKGSFGEVRRARHLKARVDCAIKIIKKKAIEKHEILVNLMHNELKVLEETVRNIYSILLSYIDTSTYNENL